MKQIDSWPHFLRVLLGTGRRYKHRRSRVTTRIEQPLKQTLSSTSVITQEDIKIPITDANDFAP
jgi:hypothetical protein